MTESQGFWLLDQLNKLKITVLKTVFSIFQNLALNCSLIAATHITTYPATSQTTLSLVLPYLYLFNTQNIDLLLCPFSPLSPFSYYAPGSYEKLYIYNRFQDPLKLNSDHLQFYQNQSLKVFCKLFSLEPSKSTKSSLEIKLKC